MDAPQLLPSCRYLVGHLPHPFFVPAPSHFLANATATRFGAAATAILIGATSATLPASLRDPSRRPNCRLDHPSAAGLALVHL